MMKMKLKRCMLKPKKKKRLKIAFHYCAKKNLKDEIKKKNRDQNSRKKYVKDQIQNLKLYLSLVFLILEFILDYIYTFLILSV